MKPNILLLAEDLEDDIFLFERALRRRNIACVVRVASNGNEALDYLFGKNKFANRVAFPLPSLVILDIKMPEMDGLEALKHIRQDARLSKLPVLIFTSSKCEEDVELAYELGANAYMVKPADINQLGEMLEVMTKFWFGINVLPNLRQV
ncbi:response regulator [Pedosphaera parvula]|uniref:Response regulator receiver protein n=1 Tax=Pedosphaera parvula (strain Ellin514) TaxID=320771 RepID=B9XR45_PEDPL|nr:response regulator [Pedosphaera parvula]EEF57658.1 response regulator receiver protein [Pedosphaera parvula Ellin514]